MQRIMEQYLGKNSIMQHFNCNLLWCLSFLEFAFSIMLWSGIIVQQYIVVCMLFKANDVVC